MPISTIISKGRTTVPKEVREALDLHAGDQLTWEIKDGHVLITKRQASTDGKARSSTTPPMQ
jgi:AbrB family looped-hinge helix DNA binding protein